MVTFLLLAALFVNAMVCFGALQQGRDEIRSLQAYILLRYGEDLSKLSPDELAPVPTWMNAVDGWLYPDRLLAKVRRLVGFLGVASFSAMVTLGRPPSGYVEMLDALGCLRANRSTMRETFAFFTSDTPATADTLLDAAGELQPVSLPTAA